MKIDWILWHKGTLEKIAGYYNAKESMAYVQLNHNFVQIVLKKQWARPKTCCRKNAGLERWKT